MGTSHRRDKRRRHGEANYRLIRYADDFVVVVAGERCHAERLREQVTGVLAPMGLRLSPEKTRVVHIDEGFDFLGFRIRRMRKRGTDKSYVYTVPSKKAIASIKDKIRTRTSRSTLHMSLADLLAGLGRTLRGWANYFRHGVSKAVFNAIDSYAWEKIAKWIRRKHNRVGWPELRRRFCDKGWRFASEGVIFTGASSVAVNRYRYRGSNIATPWTPKPTAAVTG